MNRVADAVVSWQASEKAASGSVRDYEILQYRLKATGALDRERATLLQAVRSRDIAAAEQLVVLDARFHSDWWSSAPNFAFLEDDIALIRSTEFEDDQRAQELRQFADVVRSDQKQDGSVEKRIRESGLILGRRLKLPASDIVLARLLDIILKSRLKTPDDLRQSLGTKFIERVQRSKEPELWEALCSLTAGYDGYRKHVLQAWEATGDERFAVALNVDLERTDELSLAHPHLESATARFPENSSLAQLRLRRAMKENVPLEPYLVAAIKAEFTKFSPAPSDEGLRPSSAALRIYFRTLGNLVAGRAAGKKSDAASR
jgi:hypothetical protein